MPNQNIYRLVLILLNLVRWFEIYGQKSLKISNWSEIKFFSVYLITFNLKFNFRSKRPNDPKFVIDI